MENTAHTRMIPAVMVQVRRRLLFGVNFQTSRIVDSFDSERTRISSICAANANYTMSVNIWALAVNQPCSLCRGHPR